MDSESGAPTGLARCAPGHEAAAMTRRCLLATIADVLARGRAVEVACSSAAPAENGGRVRTGIAPEFLDQLCIDADDAVAALDAGLARGNPRRRLLVGSKAQCARLRSVRGSEASAARSTARLAAGMLCR